MDIKEIRKITGLSQEKFSKKYNIPKRTLEDWERNIRSCPEYVKDMLERCVKMDTYIQRIDFTTCAADSDGNLIDETEKEVSVIYNTQIICEKEVERLINNGMYEYNDKIITTIPKTADILKISKEKTP